MSSQYEGTPTWPNSYALADDGSKPTASEVNVALEALGDRTAWLRREISLAFSRFSAKNFASSNFANGAKIGSVAVPHGSTKANGFTANAHEFLLALVDGADLDTTILVATRDGIGWRLVKNISNPAANARVHSAIAYRDDGWVVAAMSGASSGGTGQRIEVVSPGGALDVNLRAGLSALTNYDATIFVGNRCYAFGVAHAFDGTAVPANSARIVSASLGGSFVDWTTPPGGGVSGPLAAAFYWYPCALGSVAIATCNDASGGTNTYAFIDSVSNVVTQPEFPDPSTVPISNPVVWAGKFWVVKCNVGVGDSHLYSSSDGLAWVHESTIPAAIITQLVAEQATLCAFELFNPIAGVGTGSFATTDGMTWERTALSTNLLPQTISCSTTARSAFLRSRGVEYAAFPGNLRVSAGGML